MTPIRPRHLVAFVLLLAASATAPLALAQQRCPRSLTTPDSDFADDAGPGMVRHKPTGLIWKRCAEGQSWDTDTSTCIGVAATYNWPDALARVDALNAGTVGENLGPTDWRLPNINELHSLVELGCLSPAISLTQFPNTPASVFWSASPHANPTDAWAVYFSDGFDNGIVRSDANRVRLVRAGQSSLNFDAAAPINGACGGASGTPSATAPAANLCSAGSVATAITGSSGQWRWGCNGVNGGTGTAANACTASYASQTISLSASPTSIAAGGTSAITASSTSGLAVTLAPNANCALAGTTATGTAAGTCTITASQAGTGDSGTQRYLAATNATVDIAVTAVLPVMEGSAPGGTAGQPYPGFTPTLGPANVTQPVTYVLASGSLPPGLTLNPGTGAITGTPTQEGTYSFTLVASNAGGDSAPLALTIVVAAGTVAAVPGLGEWALMVLGLLAAGLGARRLRKS